MARARCGKRRKRAAETDRSVVDALCCRLRERIAHGMLLQQQQTIYSRAAASGVINTGRRPCDRLPVCNVCRFVSEITSMGYRSCIEITGVICFTHLPEFGGTDCARNIRTRIGPLARAGFKCVEALGRIVTKRL